MSRKRAKTKKVRRIVNVFKKIIAFFFSHIGLCALVIAYALLGALTFKGIELPHEIGVQEGVVSTRDRAIARLWIIAFKTNNIHEDNLTQSSMDEIMTFKNVVMSSIRLGYDGKDTVKNPQWSMSGAFLYALTVITTIGYGHIAPRTWFGKGITIIYAIIGIPLMLLFLTNVGDFMAKFFRYAYGRVLKCQRQTLMNIQKRRLERLRRYNSSVSQRSKYGRGYARSKHSGGPLMDEYGTRDKLRRDDYSLGSLEGIQNPPLTEEPLDEIAMDTLSQRYADEQFSQKESTGESRTQIVAAGVPISIIMLVMGIYLLMGAILFCVWESWGFIEAFYFCFISLTTIGFGDLVPGSSISGDVAGAQEKLVICSLYLLFGMALIAMCFNLAQEEVVNKVTRIAMKLGMVKTEDDND